MLVCLCGVFFMSSRRRHTRCALVTGVQTCALPIWRSPMQLRDRSDGGRRLAAVLAGAELDDPLVLALPRGGVPVALEVAVALGAPLDVIVARKVGAPRDRQSVGLGQSVSVRFDLGGCRVPKKKQNTNKITKV